MVRLRQIGIIVLAIIALSMTGVVLKSMVWGHSFAPTPPPRLAEMVGRLDTLRDYDGDTFWLFNDAPAKIRMWGYDSPELKQTCSWPNGTTWDCGREAAHAIQALAQRDPVTCKIHSWDKLYKRWMAVCSVRGIEINAWMVQHGWGLVDPRFSKHYLPQQAEAERAKAGVWGGPFVKPWVWRYERKRPKDAP